MTSDNLYNIEPTPDLNYLLALSEKLSEDGYDLSNINIAHLCSARMKQELLDRGATAILSRPVLTEDVLSDNTPRNIILDTLRYKLDRCSPTHSLLIIDPYIYPSNEDQSYQSDFLP